MLLLVVQRDDDNPLYFPYAIGCRGFLLSGRCKLNCSISMVINIVTSSYPERVKKEGKWASGIELSVLNPGLCN
jgi:hypothetical protein